MEVSSLWVMLFWFSFYKCVSRVRPRWENDPCLCSLSALFERSGNVPRLLIRQAKSPRCLADDLTNGRRWQPDAFGVNPFKILTVLFRQCMIHLWISRRIPSYLYCEADLREPLTGTNHARLHNPSWREDFYGAKRPRADRSRATRG